MKFQLFVPPQGYIAQRWSEGDSLPLLGVLMLGTVLRDAGIEVDLVPADVLHYKKSDIIKRIQEFKPDILGVTTCTENRFDSFRVAKIAKKINPGIITVLGGPHISLSGVDTLSYIKDVDILVFGEAEETVLELAKAIKNNSDLCKVKGIAFKDKKNPKIVIHTGRRDPIQDLDALPIPDRKLLPIEKYNLTIKTRDGRDRKVANIITSRGCPFNCYFCSTPINWGRKTRGLSPQRVINEIEDAVYNYGVKYIWFFDDTFNYNKKRVHQIMDMIIERELDIKFTCEFRIDLVDEALLEKMKKAGLELGSFGIEAGNSTIRREIVKKDFDIELVYQFMRWSKKFDFIPGAFIIFSHYQETWNNALQTLDVIDKIKDINPLVDITTAILHVYPGTPLEKISKEIGVIPKDFSWAKKSDMRKIYVLPAAQGDVPLFKDRLSWFNIADLVMQWSTTSEKKTLTLPKVLQTLKSIRSFKDIKINLVFFISMVKAKLIKFFKKKTQPK